MTKIDNVDNRTIWKFDQSGKRDNVTMSKSDRCKHWTYMMDGDGRNFEIDDRIGLRQMLNPREINNVVYSKYNTT